MNKKRIKDFLLSKRQRLGVGPGSLNRKGVEKSIVSIVLWILFFVLALGAIYFLIKRLGA
jgi:hypothetical protein